jgi:hypothetical protein
VKLSPGLGPVIRPDRCSRAVNDVLDSGSSSLSAARTAYLRINQSRAPGSKPWRACTFSGSNKRVRFPSREQPTVARKLVAMLLGRQTRSDEQPEYFQLRRSSVSCRTLFERPPRPRRLRHMIYHSSRKLTKPTRWIAWILVSSELPISLHARCRYIRIWTQARAKINSSIDPCCKAGVDDFYRRLANRSSTGRQVATTLMNRGHGRLGVGGLVRLAEE